MGTRRQRLKRCLPLVAGLVVVSPATAQPPDAPRSKPGTPECVHHQTQVRYGAYGYDHLVQIDNGCSRAVACVVRTNVRREPLLVDVPARASRTVVTFRGSPASEFKADVVCRFDPAPH